MVQQLLTLRRLLLVVGNAVGRTASDLGNVRERHLLQRRLMSGIKRRVDAATAVEQDLRSGRTAAADRRAADVRSGVMPINTAAA